MRVCDDGGKLPVGFSPQTAEGLGLQLVRGLVQTDLRGSVEMFLAAGPPELGELAERYTDPLLPAVVDGAEADRRPDALDDCGDQPPSRTYSRGLTADSEQRPIKPP